MLSSVATVCCSSVSPFSSPAINVDQVLKFVLECVNMVPVVAMNTALQSLHLYFCLCFGLKPFFTKCTDPQ